jgi:hypothetical protein
VAMLSSVLKSKRAVQVNIKIMRTFVKLREVMSTHKELAYKITAMEKKFEEIDAQLKMVFGSMSKPAIPQVNPKRKIGFAVDAAIKALNQSLKT